MLSFEIVGGAPAVAAFVRAASTMTLTPSFGGVNTTLSYPIRTSHRDLSPADHERTGIGPGLMRLSVGIEDWEDLCQELDSALEATRL